MKMIIDNVYPTLHVWKRMRIEGANMNYIWIIAT